MQWKGRADYEPTEAQKLAEQLVAYVDRKNTTQQAFKVKMDALRKARAEEAELRRSGLFKVRQELRELLTTREEAALVLMRGWL
jgi:3-methyladenine DNA glycosylase/8-oxoguanine DNA glycosylase